MKTTSNTALSLMLGLLIVLFSLGGCGNSSNTPIVSLPAPTGGYINIAAPDENGESLVYGYIFVNDQYYANTAVTVTNASASASASASVSMSISKAITSTTTTDANGYFAVRISATSGDTINITYTDPSTGVESEALSATVPDNGGSGGGGESGGGGSGGGSGGGTTNIVNVVPMSSVNMVARDVDVDSNEGYAVIVANDGTNSEIIKVDLTTGTLNSRATFTNKLFDKIAVHSGKNYAAVLDTANKMLYWYDYSNLSDDMTPTGWDNFTVAIYDVAVAHLNDTPVTTGDFIVVTREFESEPSLGFLTTFTIGADNSLGYPYQANCISYPSDATFYPFCSLANSPAPLRATKIDIIKDGNNNGRMALVAEYNNGGSTVRTVHFFYFKSDGTYIILNIGATYASKELDINVNPYAINWYDSGAALLTDPSSGNLFAMDVLDTTVTLQTLDVGTEPKGVAPDKDNGVAFVADFSENAVAGVNILGTFGLTGTTYGALKAPTEAVYYGSGSTKRLGVILTSPDPMFEILNVE